MAINREQLLAAANYLVEAKDYAAVRREIEDIISAWDHRRVYFEGDKAILNPLVSVGVQAPHKLHQLWGIISTKRMELPKFKRNEYQRGYMLAFRRRLMLARQVEETVEGRPLSAEEWRKRKVALHSAWAKQRTAYIKSKGELTWTERNAAATEFWSTLDANLNRMLKEAKRQAKAHVAVKAKRGNPHPVPTRTRQVARREYARQ
jgi:hypothetical protein